MTEDSLPKENKLLWLKMVDPCGWKRFTVTTFEVLVRLKQKQHKQKMSTPKVTHVGGKMLLTDVQMNIDF